MEQKSLNPINNLISATPHEVMLKFGWVFIVAGFTYVLVNDVMDKGCSLHIYSDFINVDLKKETSVA